MTTTGSRRVIVVSEDLLRRIDEARREMERDQFIEACLDSLMGASDDDTQEDEEVFCFFPGSADSTPLLGVPGREPQTSSQPEAMSRPTSKPRQHIGGEARQEEGLPLGWWVPAVVLFGFGDTLTTALVLGSGGSELNPVMRTVLSLPGGMWSFAVVKTVILAVLMFIASGSAGITRWLIPFIATAVGSYLVWHNLLQFIRH